MMNKELKASMGCKEVDLCCIIIFLHSQLENVEELEQGEEKSVMEN